MIRSLTRWCLWWIALWALWLVLIDTTATPEVVAAVIAATVVATLMAILLGQRIVQFQPRIGWFWLVASHLFVKCFTDSVTVVVTIWRCILMREQVSGQFRAVPFDVGGADSRSAARRVLVILGLSLAPNSYVVNVDDAEGRLLVHQLVYQQGTSIPEAKQGKQSEQERSWPF